MGKAKPSKEELVDLALTAVRSLEEQIKEWRSEINLREERIADAERKIRWLKRELIEQ